ncbi:oxidoreductase NAD-binding domain-containing protein 1 [Acrasis kona]|uniref:Oxidoreductase NAD-binding domain-containing protein 1 n=1 Tax=Acrasis kona TaxID=1008807 RepID=A0AAW2ZNR1_9EUKA
MRNVVRPVKQAFSSHVSKIFKISEDVRTLHLSVNTTPSQPFKFLPGQSINIINNNDSAGYSLISTPKDAINNNIIKFAVRRTHHPVTRTIHDDLKVGDVVNAEGPEGDFYFVDGLSERIILIAGGIGITPLLSIMNYVYEENIKVNVKFIHSVRFKKESEWFLQDITKFSLRDNFNPHILVTDEQVNKESFINNRKLDQESLREYCSNEDIKRGLFYICGPLGMIDFVKITLQSMGVSVERIIH